STLRDVIKALHANQFIGIVADQHDPSEKLILDFFGRKATVPRGPALFAIKTGCPILPYLLRRERYDRHVIIPCKPIYPPDNKDLEAGIREMSLTYLKFFEDTIRKYPDQWMWTHRRWKI
ncbi:MAG: lysophospholipid acyltransferase family protein, partial [Candidatus Zixiibacteriota bacterium]